MCGKEFSAVPGTSRVDNDDDGGNGENIYHFFLM